MDSGQTHGSGPRLELPQEEGTPGCLLVLAMLLVGGALAWALIPADTEDGIREVVGEIQREIREDMAEERGEPTVERDAQTSSPEPQKQVRVIPSPPPEPEFPFHAIPDLYPDAMGVDLDSLGNIWITTKYGVTRFEQGNRDERLDLLTPEIYKQKFAAENIALAVGHVSPTGEYWAGSWKGHVIRYDHRSFEFVSGSDEEPRGQIQAITSDFQTVYVGGNGLFFLHSESGAFEPVPEFQGKQVSSLVLDGSGRLLVGTRDGVWRREEEGWNHLWEAEPRDQEVSAIHVLKGDHLILGTHNGTVILQSTGMEITRELKGKYITSFARASDGMVIVGSWNEGFFVGGGGQWKKFDEEKGLLGSTLSSLAVDEEDQLWLAVYGKGVQVVSTELPRRHLLGLAR